MTVQPEYQHIFEPRIGIWEMLAVATPLVVAAAILAFGVMLSHRFRVGFMPRAAFGSLVVASALAASLLAVSYTGRDRMATLAFYPDRLVVSGPFREETFTYSPKNRVGRSESAVVLESGPQRLKLPVSGSWQLENLEVDALFLANEFEGRSRASSQVTAGR